MTQNTILNYPFALLAISILVLWGAAWLGSSFRRRIVDDGQRSDFGVILGATLTLLGLIIGFSFSMASNRYDQRKSFEEAEANAIGTEFVRAALLPQSDATHIDAFLRTYLRQRISFYNANSASDVQRVNVDTAQTQNELWTSVRLATASRPTPISALVLSGMNDVLNSAGYTQASWWNRIPASAWILMILIAVCANVLVGYGSHQGKGRAMILFVVPLLASIAFALIADLDSPRGGLIHVRPQNLESLAQSLPPTR